MIIHNVDQNSEEWLNLRLGKFTASNFHIMLGNSQTRITEIYKKAAERITRKRCDQDVFKNIHIERGHELEPLAKEVYFFETGNQIKEVGFVALDDFVGCSPDGLVGDDGIVEIKCVDNHTFLKVKNRDSIDPQHKTQVQFCMMVTGRKWADYIIYNPNFGEKGLLLKRIKRDDKYIGEIEIALDRAKKELFKEEEFFYKKKEKEIEEGVE